MRVGLDSELTNFAVEIEKKVSADLKLSKEKLETIQKKPNAKDHWQIIL